MESVKLNFLLIFLLILVFSHQGYADCSWSVKSNTEFESAFGWKGWRKEIKVIAIKDQGVDGYFNPRIKVCSYGGEEYPEYCHELYKTSCKKIYGTQDTGAGVSAMVFIDWEGSKTSVDAKIADGLGWEWADGVTDEEKIKFANSPKICACSQKGACRSGFAKFWDKSFSAIDYGNLCDTCYQTTVKCVPVPLAPGPPPFCEQLGMSPPQVKIVPITNKDNDYFNPKVKVIIGDLKGRDGKLGEKLGFPKEYGEDKAEEHPVQNQVKDKGHYVQDESSVVHYFETYREKDKLCAKYYGTQNVDKENLQFVRCFPAPPAPEPEVVEVVNENTLKIKIEMSGESCMEQVNSSYRYGYCTFDVNCDVNESRKKIDPRSFRVVKPRIVQKTTKNSNDESNITDVIESIFESSSRFDILKQYGYIPNIGIQLPNGNSYSLTNPGKSDQSRPAIELDNTGQPQMEVRYMRVKNQENCKSKMLCLSGWKPEPEEFVLERDGEIISLKSIGARYVKYNAVYSKESNQFYYLPSEEEEEKKKGKGILTKPQGRLDEMIFNKQEYVFFSDENKQEKGKCSYCVDRDSEIDEKLKSGEGLKVVYKLVDVEHKGKCEQGYEDCICLDGVCSRSTQYLKDGEPFYLRYEEVDCRDEDGKTLKNEKGEIQKCTQLKDRPIKANRTEVLYADKLCRLDLNNIKKRVLDVIEKRLRNKTQDLPIKSYEFSGNNDYTDDLSQYDYVEIKAWGGGEAGHIAGMAHSTESRAGMPGDYIRAKLKVDPEHPIIRVKVTEGGGRQEDDLSNKDGGPIFIEMCNLHMQDCKPLITVAGGGIHRKYGGQEHKETKIYEENLKLEEKIIKGDGVKFSDGYMGINDDGKFAHFPTCTGNTDINIKSAHGYGGCINRSSRKYSRGYSGYVEISAIQVGDEIKKIVDALVDLKNNVTISDLIKKLYPGIAEEIKEEIKRELLGSVDKILT